MAEMTYELSEARLGSGLERLRNNKILCDAKLEANGIIVFLQMASGKFRSLLLSVLRKSDCSMHIPLCGDELRFVQKVHVQTVTEPTATLTHTAIVFRMKSFNFRNGRQLANFSHLSIFPNLAFWLSGGSMISRWERGRGAHPLGGRPPTWVLFGQNAGPDPGFSVGVAWTHFGRVLASNVGTFQ